MSDEAQPSKVTLRVGDSEGISPRRINPEDLAAINRELRNFSVNVEWKISDELGEHAGDDLDSVLKNVIWETVQGFDCSAYIDSFTSLIRIFENMGRRLTISWESDAGPHRESAERTYKKTLLLLEHYPRLKSGTSTQRRLRNSNVWIRKKHSWRRHEYRRPRNPTGGGGEHAELLQLG